MINNLYIEYKLLLRFSSYLSFLSSVFTYRKQRKDTNMTTSKSNGAYDTLISLRDKLTRLNGVITPEAADKLEDELGGIFTVTKTHHYVQGQKYGHLAPSQNTDSSSVTQHGHTVYQRTPERTPRMP